MVRVPKTMEGKYHPSGRRKAGMTFRKKRLRTG
jgi:hypothetical protein